MHFKYTTIFEYAGNGGGMSCGDYSIKPMPTLANSIVNPMELLNSDEASCFIFIAFFAI